MRHVDLVQISTTVVSLEAVVPPARSRSRDSRSGARFVAAKATFPRTRPHYLRRLSFYFGLALRTRSRAFGTFGFLLHLARSSVPIEVARGASRLANSRSLSRGEVCGRGGFSSSI